MSPSPDAEVVVRELHTPAEMKAAEEIQAMVWNRAETVPAHMLMAQAKNGGIVLGAFTRSASGGGVPVTAREGSGVEFMIGMSHSFPGRDPGPGGSGEVWLYSHMTGVLEAYRGAGVGFSMKLRQRKLAIERGYAEIRWTFDPLYYPNARLNLAKLGGVVRTYLVDYYGELSDSFSSGVPSDRFLLQWYLRSERVRALLDGGCLTKDAAASTRLAEGEYLAQDAIGVSWRGGRARPENLCRTLSGPVVTVPVPCDVGTMRKEDLGLAREWRLATREAFLHYLPSGYAVTDVLPPDSAEPGTLFRYVLTLRGTEPCR